MDTGPPSGSIPSSTTETDVDDGYEWASLDSEDHAIQCPVCWRVFPSTNAVCEHLYDDPGCSHKFIPTPSAFTVPDRSPDKPRTGQFHPTSGYIYNLSDSNTFERMRQEDRHSARDNNPYFPFIDRDEWELVKFLHTNLTQTQINSFLKLRWVSSRSQPSFHSAQELLSLLDAIPKGPVWHCTKINTKGYVTKEPVYLFWRDALEVTREIFGDPVFAQHMEYDPYKIFDGTEREYGEWMSGDEAHQIQDQLPAGTTIVPIVLASDKAPVTRMTGDIEMHPLFLTVANINSKVRMKATSHAWVCIAYTPTPEFLTHPDFHSVLEARVWHRCVDIVCAGLKLAAHISTFMSDPSNLTCYCFTPLVAYTADLPEQLMITCVTKSVSPVTIAETSQFGDAIPYAPRDGDLTLQKLHELCQKIDPWRLQEFLVEAKKHNLSGVQLPFWRNWRFSNPSIFLIGELLHYGHKLFFDHPFKWCKVVLGHDEIDVRYHTQHKRVGIRHFNGVSQVSQMTGREHRDLQRTIVATIAGLADPDFVCAIRAIIDFLYRAQAPTFTPLSIRAMEESLQEFHLYKGAILRAGARRGKSQEIPHFQIPKLELLQLFSRGVRNSGSLIPYTADVSERLLITHCKDPFTRTNRQRSGFTQQIVLLLDREESIQQFDLYSLLRERDVGLTNMSLASDDPRYVDPTMGWVQHVAPEEVNHFHGPRTFRNHFLKGIVTEDSTTAFHVNVKPDFADKPPNYLVMTYHLPDFPALLQNYIDAIPGDHPRLHGRLLKGWSKFQLQLQSHLCPSDLLPSQQVQALPPSIEHPYGKCDTVLVHYTPPSPGISTAVVAQVRAIFSFSARGSPLPAGLSNPFLYVQYFAFTATPAHQPDVAMYTVQHMFSNNPDGSRSRVGAIILLLDVIHSVELIPKYGVAANRNITSETCLELYDEFYLNNFTDKEWYHTMYDDYH